MLHLAVSWLRNSILVSNDRVIISKMIYLLRIHNMSWVVVAAHRVLQDLFIKNLSWLLCHYLLFFITNWTSLGFGCSLCILFVVKPRCVSRTRWCSRLCIIWLLVMHLSLWLYHNNWSHLWWYVLISISL